MKDLVYSYPSEYFRNLYNNTVVVMGHFLPIIEQHVGKITSVVDFGCAMGGMLEVCQREGITDILGLDGPWLNPDILKIPKEKYKSLYIGEPLDLGRKFDLVINAETIEHVENEDEDVLIENLVKHGEVIFFSGALVGQCGAGHINEQWPEHWAAKFAKHDYHPVDVLRTPTWRIRNVSFWYSQNSFLYISKARLEAGSVKLRQAWKQTDPKKLTKIHPKCRARPKR